MHTLELGDKVMEGNIRALKKVRTVAFLLDDFAFKALSTLILAPCSFMFCFHGLTVLTSKLSSINNRNFQIAASLFFL